MISTRLIAGTPEIRVYADALPEEGYLAVDPDLEDVYFHQVTAAAAAAAEAA